MVGRAISPRIAIMRVFVQTGIQERNVKEVSVLTENNAYLYEILHQMNEYDDQEVGIPQLGYPLSGSAICLFNK